MSLPKDRNITESEMVNMPNAPIGVVFFNTTRGVYVAYNGVYWSEIKDNILWYILQSEDFESGVMPTNFHVVNDSSSKWVVGTAEKYAGNYGLYISNDGGATASYTNNQVSHFYFDINLPANMSRWRLRSFWKGVSEVNYDFTKVYLDENASYVPTAHNQVSTSATVYQVGSSQYNNQANWVEDTIEFDNSLAGTTVRIIVSFRSDGSVVNNPPTCLDNFYVEYLP